MSTSTITKFVDGSARVQAINNGARFHFTTNNNKKYALVVSVDYGINLYETTSGSYVLVQDCYKAPTFVNAKVNYTFTAANTWEYTGLSLTIPAKSEVEVMFWHEYMNASPKGIAVTISDSHAPSATDVWRNYVYEESNCRGYVCGYFPDSVTLYVWAKAGTANTNGIYKRGVIRTYP